MIDNTKTQPTHLRRTAFVYIRQSSAAQVEYNRESTARQYALVERAQTLGWQRDQVTLIDEDLGLSGASTDKRTGFAPFACTLRINRPTKRRAWLSELYW
jgi:DNA invertase Pin-like site-specific DNA recombinase